MVIDFNYQCNCAVQMPIHAMHKYKYNTNNEHKEKFSLQLKIKFYDFHFFLPMIKIPLKVDY